MRVLIDADGCPVVDIVISLCQKYGVPCVLLCDTAHEFCRKGINTLVFDKGTDSVDYAIINRVTAGDLVITQDYGLASMCLARSVRVLHQDGWEYTPDNIDGLLFMRHESKKLRASGVRLRGQKKRIASQNEQFRLSLENILQTTVHG